MTLQHKLLSTIKSYSSSPITEVQATFHGWLSQEVNYQNCVGWHVGCAIYWPSQPTRGTYWMTMCKQFDGHLCNCISAFQLRMYLIIGLYNLVSASSFRCCVFACILVPGCTTRPLANCQYYNVISYCEAIYSQYIHLT